ncbi:PAS domain-containing protein [Pelagibius sp. CAU 1746]|uniref:PAS domain-containing protein n=1 Tax=Pelagibius sp. CAU 1746 TaxID=3140370 RepID=UPI00325BC7D0
MKRITDEDEIESADIRALFRYWRSKCPEGGIPRRADIDPVDIPRLMPKLLIADIERNPFRVRYRLVGTRIVEMTGFEFTGRYLDEIALEDYEGPFQECYQTACETKSPIITRISWSLTPGLTAEYDVCFLPLSDDGETANMALSLECYQKVERDFTLLAGRVYTATKCPDR